MVALAISGYTIVTGFTSLKPDGFAALSKTLGTLGKLFDMREAEIFNQGFAREHNDGKRRQITWEQATAAADPRSPAQHALLELERATRKLLTLLPGGYTAKKPTIIRSIAGCKQQAMHTDYEPYHSDFKAPATAPLGMLFPVSKTARLVLQEKAPASSRPRTVTIRRGEAIVFRGDQIHGGAAYSEVNYRVFSYIHKDTYTQPVDPVTYLA